MMITITKAASTLIQIKAQVHSDPGPFPWFSFILVFLEFCLRSMIGRDRG